MADMLSSYAPSGDVTTTTQGGISPRARQLLDLYRRLAARQASTDYPPAAAAPPRAAGPGHEAVDPLDTQMKLLRLQEAQGAPIYADQSGGVFTGMETRAGQIGSAATGRYRRDQKIPGGNVY